MKVTLNWLKQYVDFDWSPEELAERLTMLGLEVEGVEKLGGEFDGIVVAQVITRDKHPNADKLSVCRVNDGKGERQIVCGAQNFKAGDKVPLILPGATLPAQPGEKPFTIKVGKMRGVESHGMMCSPQELGLARRGRGIDDSPGRRRGRANPLPNTWGVPARTSSMIWKSPPTVPTSTASFGIAREICGVDRQSAEAATRRVCVRSPRYPNGRRIGGCAHRRCGAVPAIHRPRCARRQNWSQSGLAALDARKGGHPQHQQRRGRDQLRDAGNRPAAARV